MIELSEAQKKAVQQLKNGSILCGGVGSGKSRVALSYYFFQVCQGRMKVSGSSVYTKYQKMKTPRDLYIITTAKKRDSLEWEKECTMFSLSTDPKVGLKDVNVVIDSWNRIKNYQKVSEAFFIFDEQRVIGSGAWVKSFLNITRKNQWILLSATPGDQWTDYIPVFVANGFYRNKSEFTARHCVYARFSKYPKIERYLGEDVLESYRDSLLVNIDEPKHTERINISVSVEYDRKEYRTIMKDRWNVFENCPIRQAGELIYLLRKSINSHFSRLEAVRKIMEDFDRVILFYNFDYELELLRDFLSSLKINYQEWNGHKHENLPDGEKWVYLVQYMAGAEGWECITTNTVVFYSQTYSYRILEQASGRIDRRNTPYQRLYYYHLQSTAPIDLAIRRALKNKKTFNERAFLTKI